MPSLYDASRYTIRDLFRSAVVLSVPEFQRPYSWEKKQWEEYLMDIQRFASKYPGKSVDAREYFLGAVVMVDRQDTRDLLDGQQRLATTAIFFSALRDVIAPLDPVTANAIVSEYLIGKSAFRAETPRIRLSQVDRDFFEREILVARDPKQTEPRAVHASHHRIRNAKKFFTQSLAALVRPSGSAETRIAEIVRLGSVIAERVTVVGITSADEDNAADVFETLNDRGTGLAIADLLKNYLLREAATDKREQVGRAWEDARENHPGKRFQVFLRHFWISRHGDLKSKTLYRAMKDSLEKSATSSENFVAELRTAADTYRRIVEGVHSSKPVEAVLKKLRAAGAVVCYPTILALLARADLRPKYPSLLTALLAYYVRHTLVGRREGDDIENVMYGLAHDISKGASASHVVAELKRTLPTDAEFEKDFSTIAIKTPAARRYVLEELEAALWPNGAVQSGSADRVHVEHIYPQKPAHGKRWRLHEDYVNRVGNLTLLDAPLNKRIKNAGFEAKRSSYNQCALRLTEDLVAYATWSPKQVAARQRTLAKQAVKIWRVG